MKPFNEEHTNTYCVLAYADHEIGTLSCTPAFVGDKQITRRYVWFLKISENEFRFADTAKELENVAVLRDIETIRIAS